MKITIEDNELLSLDDKFKIETEFNNYNKTHSHELVYNVNLKKFLLMNSRTQQQADLISFSFSPSDALNLAEAINLYFNRFEWNDDIDKGVKKEINSKLN